MDKTRTIDKKWLANELDLHFLVLKKCTKFQSNRSILSKVIVYTDRHTDRQSPSQKPFFSHSGGLKTWRFDEKRGAQILYKSNTFSDENVKKLLSAFSKTDTRKTFKNYLIFFKR